MKERKGLHIFLLLALALTFSMTGLYAGITGKISGKVVDLKTAEPLTGVNIVIENTSFGAATDMNGSYFILNIPPGTYMVRADYMGYTSLRKTDVAVIIDNTTPLNFSLEATVLDVGGTVTVVAEREVVDMDVSFTQVAVDAKTIEEIPASFRMTDALQTQAGVGQNSQGITIRGSDSREISVYVDGVDMRNERMDRGFDQVSMTAIQEIQVLTGAFNAEYGNARAGVVNIVNRNPGSKYFLNLETRYSPLWGGDDSGHPGLKHFGPYIYSDRNWWDYGRYAWNDGNPAEDRDGNGKADFIGWTAWASANKFKDQTLTAEQAYQIYRWQHRSEDQNGNVLYNEESFGTVDELYNSWSIHNDPFNHYGYRGDMIGDVTLGGPVPFTGNRITFMLSHLLENSMYPHATPEGSVYGYNTTQGKLIFNFNDNMKLSLNGTYQDAGSFNIGDPEPRDGLDGKSQLAGMDMMEGQRAVFNRDGYLVPKGIYTSILNATWTHILNPKTFYEVKLTFGNFRYTQYGNVRLRNLGEVYQVGSIWMDETPKGWTYQQGDNRDILNLYDMRGERSSDLSDTQTMSVSADLTSQITQHHQLKAGLTFTYKDILERTGYTQNLAFLISEEYRNGPDGVWGTADDGGTGDQANWHDVHVYPMTAGAYIQDRMEYGGMILNVGLRMDIHKPNKDWYDRNDPFYWADAQYYLNHWERYGDNYKVSGYANYYGYPIDSHPPVQVMFMPRLGISHPVGAESKIFFNYGHFYDMVTSDNLYRIQLGLDEPLEEIGNPWLRLPRTIQFEAGWEQRLYGDYVAQISAFYRDISDDLVMSEYLARQGSPEVSINGLGRDVKGVEFRMEKRYGTYFTGFVSTEFRSEKQSYYSFEGIPHLESQDYLDDPTLTSMLSVVDDPFINVQQPGRWNVKANVAFHTPMDFGPGPELLGAKLLGAWDLSLYYQFYQGAKYSWNPDGLEKLNGVLNERYKDYHMTNLHVEKRLRFAGITAGAFLEITNLFNYKNLDNTNWNNLTSSQDYGDRTKMQRAYMEAIIAEGKRIGDETDDPTLMPQRIYRFWGAPRDWWLGLKLYFN